MCQSFRIKDPEIKDLNLDIADEELGRTEMIAHTMTSGLRADLLGNIASVQRAQVVYEYLYHQIDDMSEKRQPHPFFGMGLRS